MANTPRGPKRTRPRETPPSTNRPDSALIAARLSTTDLEGTYDELMDAAEDLAEVLSASESNQLDLTPFVERWLIAQLEDIEVELTRHSDSGHAAGVVLGGAA